MLRLLGKRRREDPPLEESVQGAVNQLLEAAALWLDPCGRPYRLQTRLDHSAEKATVRVRGAERVTRAQLAAAVSVLRGGSYHVADYWANLGEAAVYFVLTRRGAAQTLSLAPQGAGAPAHPKNTQPIWEHEPPSLPPEDASAVRTLQARARLALGWTDVQAQLRRLPAHYRVTFTGGTTVPRAAFNLTDDPANAVDFSAQALVLRLKRATPEVQL